MLAASLALATALAAAPAAAAPPLFEALAASRFLNLGVVNASSAFRFLPIPAQYLEAEINARLKEIKDDKEATEETAILNRWLKLAEQEAALKREVKDRDAGLDELANAMYPKLSEADIKCLVIDDKWMARLNDEITIELERASQSLTSRICELSARYNATLAKLADETETHFARVDKHLESMGISWK